MTMPQIITNTNKRVFGLIDHYRQKLNGKITYGKGFGHFGGGSLNSIYDYDDSQVSVVNRLSYSNDSTTATIRGPLTIARSDMGSSGNSTHGWFAGGQTGFSSVSSRVDRIDFANDSSAASTRSSMIASNAKFSTSSTNDYAWYSGGFVSAIISSIQRLSYANDTNGTNIRANLPNGARNNAGTGNTTYGWVSGGFAPEAVFYSNVSRIDYSNDTNNGTNRFNMPQPTFSHTATGNTTYGWFAGGLRNINTFIEANITNIVRMTYASDTSGTSPRALLYFGICEGAVTTNATDSWISGGIGPNYEQLNSAIQRYSFASDTSTTAPLGRLSSSRRSHGGV